MIIKHLEKEQLIDFMRRENPSVHMELLEVSDEFLSRAKEVIGRNFNNERLAFILVDRKFLVDKTNNTRASGGFMPVHFPVKYSNGYVEDYISGVIFVDKKLVYGKKRMCTMNVGVLIHEIVHFTQCITMGVQEYLNTFKTYTYEESPLEREAYEFQYRFLEEENIRPIFERIKKAIGLYKVGGI